MPFNMIYPFKRGMDDTFRSSFQEEAKPTVYDSIGGVPENTFEGEYSRFQAHKWRKGIIHTLTPSAIGGALLGLCWGIYESRRGMIRNASRFKVVWQQVVVCTGVCVSTSVAHHSLVMLSSYREARWQPMLAGVLGGSGYTMMVQGGISGAGVSGGFIIGIIYSIACVFIQWYQHRHMESFFSTQQMRETPIHKISPELQNMYRSYLFDNRPIEDTDELKKRALLNSREERDLRLDAQAYREAMKLQPVFDRIVFPEWWPLKMTEKDQLIEQRMRDDAVARRINEFTDDTSNGSFFLTHMARTEQGRSASGESLWGEDGKIAMKPIEKN